MRHKTRHSASTFAAALLLLAASAAGASPKKPPVPPGRDPGGVAVAIIGEGLDYTRPEIASRLARDGEGEIVGFDLIDRDRQPVDTAPASAHPATIVLREAPGSRIAIFRAAMYDMRHKAEAVAMIAMSPARIALDARPDDQGPNWQFLREAERRFPDLLIVVPAGDGNAMPGAIAGLAPATSIIVTATSPSGGPAGFSNRSTYAIDVAVDAVEGDVPTPSIAAAARIAALAARICAREPGITGAALKARLISLAEPFPAGQAAVSRSGRISPAAHFGAR